MDAFIIIEKDHLNISADTCIIKADDYCRLVKANDLLNEARTCAKEIMAKAEAEADQILGQARLEYSRQTQKGYQKGVETAKQDMSTQISTTALHVERYLAEMEEKTVQLVMNIVNKIIGAMDQEPLIRRLVKKSLDLMKNHRQLILKVAPVHLDHINLFLRNLEAEAGFSIRMEIKSDHRMNAGDLILESDMGIVDAGLETQLAVIEQALAKCLKTRGGTSCPTPV